MSFSYSAGASGVAGLSRARRLLGDNVENDESGARIYDLEDEEITACLAAFTSFNFAVADLADGLATKFSREAEEYRDETGVATKMQARIDRLEKLAHRLRTEGAEMQPGSSGASLGAIGGRSDNPFCS